jgi:hypothetical protein
MTPRRIHDTIPVSCYDYPPCLAWFKPFFFAKHVQVHKYSISNFEVRWCLECFDARVFPFADQNKYLLNINKTFKYFEDNLGLADGWK